MNNRSFLILSLTAVVFASAHGVCAQTPSQIYTRPRVVSLSQQTQTPAATPAAPTAQAPATRQGQTTPPAAQQGTTVTTPATPSTFAQPSTIAQPSASPATQIVVPYKPLLPARPLSVNKFRERVAEAETLLKSRLTLTSMTPNTAFVTIAALDQ